MSFLCSSLTSACTLLGSIERHAVVEVETVPGWTSDIGEGPSWSFRSALPLAGHAGAVELARGDQRLSVRCTPIAWDQDWIGPILPIFPVPMGASSTRINLDVEVWVESCRGGLVLRPSDVRVEFEGRAAVVPDKAAVQWTVDDDAREDEVAVGDVVTLTAGQVLVVTYPLWNHDLSSFELVLPADLAEQRPPRIGFRHENTTVLFYYVPFLGK